VEALPPPLVVVSLAVSPPVSWLAVEVSDDFVSVFAGSAFVVLLSDFFVSVFVLVFVAIIVCLPIPE
jgi:hypothetical protein